MKSLNVPKRVKEEVYLRDKLCKECGSKESLEIHHIIPKQQGINHSLDNLILLCKKCHLKKGISNRTSKKRKLIVLQINFEEKEFKELLKLKGDLSWREFIFKLLEKDK